MLVGDDDAVEGLISTQSSPAVYVQIFESGGGNVESKVCESQVFPLTQVGSNQLQVFTSEPSEHNRYTNVDTDRANNTPFQESNDVPTDNRESGGDDAVRGGELVGDTA